MQCHCMASACLLSLLIPTKPAENRQMLGCSHVWAGTPPATHAGPRLLHFCVSDAAVRHLWRFPARQLSDMPAMQARSRRGLAHVVHMTAGSSSFAQRRASIQWLTPCSQTWLLGSNPGVTGHPTSLTEHFQLVCPASSKWKSGRPGWTALHRSRGRIISNLTGRPTWVGFIKRF